jgi:uncharacterized protein YbjQ (UPF0145 family)
MTTPPSQGYGLPQAAQSRLTHDTQPGAAATAFLSHGDFLTLRQMGFEPLAGVVGLSVMHIGGIQTAGYKQAVELEVYSNAISLGQRTAMARMQEEAGTLGADGVVIDHMNERYIGEEHEYLWAGTAVRFVPSPGALRTANGLPFVFLPKLPVLYQMMRAGYAPVTYGIGVSVYHVPHRSMRQALGQTFQNTEVPLFTDAWYTAREIALSRLQAYVEQQGADLLLSMNASMSADAFGEHTAEFRISGDGWRRAPGLEQIIPAVDLTPEALIARGLLVTGPETGTQTAPAAAAPPAAAPPEAPAPPQAPAPPA